MKLQIRGDPIFKHKLEMKAEIGSKFEDDPCRRTELDLENKKSMIRKGKRKMNFNITEDQILKPKLEMKAEIGSKFEDDPCRRTELDLENKKSMIRKGKRKIEDDNLCENSKFTGMNSIKKSENVRICISDEKFSPHSVKVFIDKVIKSPLHDIAIHLSGFNWEESMGNFHHWGSLFLHFDAFFRTYVSHRKDLLLSDISNDDGAFPKHAVLQILRVMRTILENCPNKSSFAGLEHFKLLLASTDPDILIATLETLCVLMKLYPSKLHVSGKLIGCDSINSYLLSLAHGWGSKEEGLGLYSCVMANEGLKVSSDYENGSAKSKYRLGSILHFEFHGVNAHKTEVTSSMTQLSDLHVIHIPSLHTMKEDELLLLKQCVEQYNVPLEHRFSLLTRIRYARSFRSPGTCRLYSRICLLAFIVLVLNDAHDEIGSLFANEPGYTTDLIKIVRSEETIPGIIKTLAMLALAACSSSHEGPRIWSGSSIISAGWNNIVLLNVLQKAVLSFKNSSDSATLSFVQTLLMFYMLNVILSSSSESAIRGSEMVLQNVDYTHMHLAYSAVKVIVELMNYSAAVSFFKDLGGVELLTRWLQKVNRLSGVAGPSDESMIIGKMPRLHGTTAIGIIASDRIILAADGRLTDEVDFVADNRMKKIRTVGRYVTCTLGGDVEVYENVYTHLLEELAILEGNGEEMRVGEAARIIEELCLNYPDDLDPDFDIILAGWDFPSQDDMSMVPLLHYINNGGLWSTEHTFFSAGSGSHRAWPVINRAYRSDMSVRRARNSCLHGLAETADFDEYTGGYMMSCVISEQDGTQFFRRKSIDKKRLRMGNRIADSNIDRYDDMLMDCARIGASILQSRRI